MRQQLNLYIEYLIKAYDWLFDEITRPIEVFSGLGLFLFSMKMYVDNDLLLQLPSYKAFAYVAPPSLWLVFAAVATIQLLATAICSIKANKISGYTLTVCASIWAWIAITFGMDDLDILTTAPFIYWLTAIFSSLAGKRLLDKNKTMEAEGITEDGDY